MTDPGKFPGRYGMIGASDKMIELYDSIEEVAPRDTKVLIIGERGTGKELVAKAIHDNSKRKNKPYVIINCAAFQPTLLESEMFGHERGAFTDAYKQKTGKFQYADGGTIFMDEIADISPDIQAKLLRVIEYGEFQRVGGNETLKSDVRVITATSKDIEKLIHQDKFRHELHDRINVFSIMVPALRERGRDVHVLIEYFIGKYGGNGIAPEALDELAACKWPGNVRQLESAIERLVIRSHGEEISRFLVKEHGMLDTGHAKNYPKHSPDSLVDYKGIDSLKTEITEKMQNFVNEISNMRKYLEKQEEKTTYFRHFLENEKPRKVIPGKKEESPAKKHSRNAEAKETISAYTFSHMADISLSTIYALSRREFAKPPEERSLKCTVDEGEMVTTIGDLSDYFKGSSHSKNPREKIEVYMKDHPGSESLEIHIKRNPRD